MSMSKWSSPLEEMDLFRKNLDQLFTSTLSGLSTGFSPPIEVVEGEDAYYVRMYLPGLPSEHPDEHIRIDGTSKTLTISGELQPPELAGNEKMLISQFRYGQFYKQLNFPDGVDPDKIDAHYRSGLLEVKLPKSQASQKRSIQIRTK